MLEVKNLYTGYDKKEIIKNINFEIKRGENLCIVGRMDVVKVHF